MRKHLFILLLRLVENFLIGLHFFIRTILEHEAHFLLKI